MKTEAVKQNPNIPTASELREYLFDQYKQNRLKKERERQMLLDMFLKATKGKKLVIANWKELPKFL